MLEAGRDLTEHTPDRPGPWGHGEEGGGSTLLDVLPVLESDRLNDWSQLTEKTSALPEATDLWLTDPERCGQKGGARTRCVCARGEVSVQGVWLRRELPFTRVLRPRGSVRTISALVLGQGLLTEQGVFK